MPSEDVRITNAKGLHARASAKVVGTAAKLPPETSVHITKGASTVSGRDIMDLLMLGAACGDTITINVEGGDADAALKKFVGLVMDGFGED